MPKATFAQKYTDIEYLSKKEVAEQIGGSTADSIWRQVNEYREKYRFPLDIKRVGHIPFSIVLTPSIMGVANTTERLMMKFYNTFERYKNRQSISQTKSLDTFKDEVIKEDLLVKAMTDELKINEKDIVVMLDEKNLHLKESSLYYYYQAWKYICDNPNLPLDLVLYKDLLSKLIGSDISDIDSRLRKNNVSEDDVNFVDIIDYLNQLFDFYNSGYELSPFIIASVMYIYILYLKPFESYNEDIALLTYMKVLHDQGFGDASYFLSIGEFLMQKNEEFMNQFEEIIHSGDITYGVVFMARLAYDAIQWRNQGLLKLPDPEPSYGNVRVVEKIVEKVIEKEVPVYIEKVVNVPVSSKSDVEIKNDSFAKSETSIKDVEEDEENIDDDISIAPFVNTEQPKTSKTDVYEFENDPFLKPDDGSSEVKEEKKVEKVNKQPVHEKVAPPIEEVDDLVLNPIIEQVKQPSVKTEKTYLTPKEKVGPLLGEAEAEQANKVTTHLIKFEPTPTLLQQVVALGDLDDDVFARRLVEMQPLLKYHQALFYAKHRTPGLFYSISQFKQFNDCAYETARTSMDFLTTLGLYHKEQIKNKFIYTPEVVDVGDK